MKKCNCGFKEQREKTETVKQYYVRGPKKGQVKSSKIVHHDAEMMSSIAIHDGTRRIYFMVCPECQAIYFDGYSYGW